MFAFLLCLSADVGVLHAHVSRLIDRLADREFAVRDAATRELAGMPFAKQQLKQAALSPVPERASRATHVLAKLEVVARAHQTLRHDTWVKDGRFDLIAEWCNLDDSTANRDAAEVVAYRAAGRAQDWLAKANPHPKLPMTAYPITDARLTDGKWRERHKDTSLAGPLPRRFPEEHPCFRMCGDSYRGDNRISLALARGSVEARTGEEAPVWITAGSVSICDNSYQGVFVADGAVRVHVRDEWFAPMTNVTRALILSNDSTVEVSGGTLNLCAIFAAGDVVIGKFANLDRCIIRAGGRVRYARPESPDNCDIQEKVANPLAPFKFFAPADVGLHAKADKTAVAVEKVDADSRFDKAGVRAGDVLLAVDGTPVVAVAELRRLVRTGYVRGDCTVKVRRGEATKELVVRFPD